MYTFQPNWNRNKISHIAPDMSQNVHEGLVWKI